MWITVKAVYDLETLQLIERVGYEYSGPVMLACSSGGQVGQTDRDIQAANAATAKTLQAHANITFAQQESVLARQTARYGQMVSNPMGYSPQELHTATTSVNDNTARAAKQAIGAAAAAGARYGAADIGGGAIGQVAGEIGSEAAQSKSQQLGQISAANEAMKRQNFLTGLQGLDQSGAAYGGASGAATSGAVGTSESAVQAGSGALAAQQAGWQNLSGVLTGIGGIAAGVTGTGGLAGLLKPGGK